MVLNSIDIDQSIVGTNSSLTDGYQMSDPNLKWLKTIIQAKERSKNKYKVNKKDLNNIQRRLMKYMPNLKITKNVIYFADEDKFGSNQQRYVIPRNEIELTMIGKKIEKDGPSKRSKRSSRGSIGSILAGTLRSSFASALIVRR